ncbi:poly-gamma-glutamate biosynthesis protein PgsC/CapC [uncultured Desulfobacter sp.]|uniref:poly-gamma-glutamate biosynthesis protein PgsC/CapC n=1 Tax=uncultured Desulfobacter sp. TaxID=240139 RepID=UPI0029C7A416|nr:poly-gamma-glutamate biosynthesis protein PgsC/CapC [uncultured Desulfobacter sp.]
MNPLILNIFPQGGLASSVTTTVWVGVCVTCFFNLRLGWVLSGLVVPGYLVPLLIIKPFAVAVIILEAMVTYFLVWGFSEFFSKAGLWHSFFGRDRFFAFLLVSVVVRLLFDTVLLPLAAENITQRLGIVFDYRNNLHSFGLIVVALMANQFWKPGLRRGLFTSFITILITYLLVRYGLMKFTNFSMGNIVYMYEDMAASMLSSPKAYIILLITSVVASRMNLHYGWDYSGILIPSLLALQWYQPMKLLYSFAETFVILGLASLVLRLPLFKEANVEGARKILLFFNIGFFYKLLTGWLLILYFPEQKITDYYGFGYLLTTLLAIKMHDKEIAVRVTRAVLQTSIVAVFISSIIGFSLTFIPNLFSLNTINDPLPGGMKTNRSNFQALPLIELIKNEKINLFTSYHKNSFISPLPREMEIFAEALKALETFSSTQSQKDLVIGKKLLDRINYSLSLVENHYLFLYEKGPRRGWGSYVINTAPHNGMVMEVPAPLEEWGALESAAWLFTSMQCKAMAVGGTKLSTNDNGASNTLQNPFTLFSTFHRTLGRRNILQIRGHTAKSIRVLSGQRTAPSLGKTPAVDSILWIKGEVPAGLDLTFLKKNIGQFQIQWGDSPFKNILRERSHTGFAELMLNREHARRIMFKAPYSKMDLSVELREESIAGYLQDWILRSKEHIAEKGSGHYQIPTFEELLYFDHEIVTPLLHISKIMYKNGQWTPEGLDELKALNLAAAAIGYEIIRYFHKTSGQDYLILSERDDLPPKRYWGMYIFRLGETADYIIQAPRPLSEKNTFEYAVSLFEQIKAGVLMISTTHPKANQDGSSDIIKLENKKSIFTLTNQVLIREFGPDPLMVVQCRAMGFNPEYALPEADALLSFKSGVKLFDAFDSQTIHLMETLKSKGLRIQLINGSQSTTGYEVGGIPQALYLDQAQNKEFSIIWLSPMIRTYYRQQTDNRLHAAQFESLGIETLEQDLFSIVSRAPKLSADFVPDYMVAMERYLETHDIISFDHLTIQWPQFHYQRIIDLNSKQSFLLIFGRSGRLTAVVNLFPIDERSRFSVLPHSLDQHAISHYITTKIAWLTWKKQ